MRSVMLLDPPPEVRSWLARRQELGLDGFDEVWEGVYHVAPMAHGRHGRTEVILARILGPRADAAGLIGSGPLNIGGPDDYRVPDQVYLRGTTSALWNPTAAVVVEIVSPGDETMQKFDFYFRQGVEELLVIDPDPEIRSVDVHRRGTRGFERSPVSELLGLTGAALASEISWPD